MQIEYSNKNIEKICTDASIARKNYGELMAQYIQILIDEIKFVERSDETKCSKLYSLSDFGTKGTNARKGKDYMNNYFMNEYGAIRDINFSPIFEEIVKK